MASPRADEALPHRRSKRLRKESLNELSIEELLPDDMSYDADVEALHPDVYEEPDSDVESAATPKRKFHSIDDDLAARMKHLGHERSGTSSPQASAAARGRKRRSLHEEVMQSRKGKTSDLEVVELVERSNPSPPKKRRKRSRPGSSSHGRTSLRRRSLHANIERVDGAPETDDAMDMT